MRKNEKIFGNWYYNVYIRVVFDLKIKIMKVKDGMLFRGDKVVNCPISPAILVPSQSIVARGQVAVDIRQMPCQQNCRAFEVTEENGEKKITCRAMGLTDPIEV